MIEVRFHAPGVPVPQPRPRVVRAGSHNLVQAVSNLPEVKAWKATVALAAKAASPGPEPFGCDSTVAVRALFVVERPGYLYRKADPDGPVPCNRRPDLDNYVKAALDALNGILWADDAQVVELSVSKAWRAKAGGPAIGLHVVARDIDPASWWTLRTAEEVF